MYFVNLTTDNLSKIGHAFRKVSVSKIEVVKKYFLQKKI